MLCLMACYHIEAYLISKRLVLWLRKAENVQSSLQPVRLGLKFQRGWSCIKWRTLNWLCRYWRLLVSYTRPSELFSSRLPSKSARLYFFNFVRQVALLRSGSYIASISRFIKPVIQPYTAGSCPIAFGEKQPWFWTRWQHWAWLVTSSSS